MTEPDIARVRAILASVTPSERHLLWKELRHEFQIHELEKKWNVSAEVILEAIWRSGDLTQRGVRGVIAEASFMEFIVRPLLEQGWREVSSVSELAYDFLLADAEGAVSIQVKMQRQKAQRPMLAVEANKGVFGKAGDMWVVETQRTRGGKTNDGEDTRPYRFGEFDIIAVSLHPSTNDWSKFRYTVGSWLLPDPKQIGRIFKFQPVPTQKNDFWTDDFLVTVSWLRSRKSKRIYP